MEIKTRVSFDSGNEYGCISVLRQTYIKFNGKETIVGNERRAFTPTQIDEVKEFAPELYDICKAMWTPEVIKRWDEYLKESQLPEA